MTSSKIVALLLSPLSLLVGCNKKASEAAGSGNPKIIVQLDWVAEPEHGAFYTAEAMGYFKDEGLDVTLVQGGPNAYVQEKVATNQAQIGQGDSTSILLAIQAGAPLVNVASIFQHDPSVLMMQVANPVNSWPDLQGKTIMMRPEWAFIPYLRKKYNLQFNVIPQNFDLGRLAVDPHFIQQGFYIAEPYHLLKKNIHLKFLFVWDTGFDAYTSIYTNRTFLKNHPEQMKAFLRALYKGYHYYLEQDGGPAHAIMLKINPKVTADYLDWSRQQIIAAHLAKNDTEDYLQISAKRYQKEIDQLTDLQILPAGSLTSEKVMDSSYLPAPSPKL